MIAKDKKAVALHLDKSLYDALDELRWKARARSLAQYIERQLRQIVDGQSQKPLPPEGSNNE